MPSANQVIGSNVRALRERQGVSLDALGRALAPMVGGTGWSKQTMWKVEKGQRDFTPADLLALAWVLDVTVPQLFETLEPVSMPAGTLAPEVVEALTVGVNHERDRLLRLSASARALRQAQVELSVLTGAMGLELSRLQAAVAGAADPAARRPGPIGDAVGYLIEKRADSWRHRDETREESDG